MKNPFLSVLAELEATFRQLEGQVPPPIKKPYKDGFLLRYYEQSPQQALLMKFARQISGLHAIDLLLMNGFVQEQCVIQRTLDDIEQDILFLTLGLSTGDWTDHHVRYLNDFWMEEAIVGASNRGMVPRDKIRAYINRSAGTDDPSSANANDRVIYKAYSGYVHVAAASTIDMCVGEPPRYLLSGMQTSPLYGDHIDDAWNYFYRGLVSATVMAKAFEDENLWAERYQSLKGFEQAFEDKIFRVVT
jgi:hypothetical protein